MTRFRGVLSTQPGSVPFSDFELTSQAQIKKHQYGPFGDQSEIPIFIQQPIQVGCHNNPLQTPYLYTLF